VTAVLLSYRAELLYFVYIFTPKLFLLKNKKRKKRTLSLIQPSKNPGGLVSIAP
jgi:hypothetical protein